MFNNGSAAGSLTDRSPSTSCLTGRKPHGHQGSFDMKLMLIRKALAVALASSGLFSTGSAFANEELFKKSNCMACHALEQKRLGPSMKQVAAKYDGDSSAVDRLAKKIREGGGGVWGQMPMPPQSQVTEADAKTLAEYILTIK